MLFAPLKQKIWSFTRFESLREQIVVILYNCLMNQSNSRKLSLELLFRYFSYSLQKVNHICENAYHLSFVEVCKGLNMQSLTKRNGVRSRVLFITWDHYDNKWVWTIDIYASIKTQKFLTTKIMVYIIFWKWKKK